MKPNAEVERLRTEIDRAITDMQAICNVCESDIVEQIAVHVADYLGKAIQRVPREPPKQR